MRMGVIAMCLLAPLGGALGAGQGKTVHFRLGNGLKVHLRPVEGAAKVALVTVYSLGELHDPKGLSGLGHLTEHVYLTAAAGETKARTAAEFMRRYPAAWNAQTGEDYTVFATIFPKGALRGELQEAAARMGDLRVTAADLDREKPRVVAELANMFGGIPALGAQNLAHERIHPRPPGGRRGGVPEQVKRITPEQVRDHWKQYYKPANAMVVLAGGFDTALARAMIVEYFGRLPSGRAAPARRPPGTPQLGRVEHVSIKPRGPEAPAQVCLAFAAPPPDSELYAPFLVIVARMWLKVVAAGASPGSLLVVYAVPEEPGVLLVSSPVGAKENAKQAVTRLERFISEAVGAEVRASDVPATKRAFAWMLGTADIPDHFLARNLYGLAWSVGRRAQLGIDSAKVAKAIEAVNTEALREAAQKVFSPGQRAGVIAVAKRQ